MLCTMLCIMFSMTAVCGFGYFWDLYYNGVFTIYALIALGLSVDYSIHIGHKFNISHGTSSERVVKTLSEIGPAVFHGVFSTFLAIMYISDAKTYLFTVFFRMLFLVVTIGGGFG